MRMFSKLTDINVVLCKTESKVQNIIQTVQLLNQTFLSILFKNFIIFYLKQSLHLLRHLASAGEEQSKLVCVSGNNAFSGDVD